MLRTFVILMLLTNLSLAVQKNSYSCQQAENLQATCQPCLSENKCTDIDQIKCKNLSSYQEQCQLQQQLAKENSQEDQNVEQPEDSYNLIEKKSNSLDNNYNAVVPKKPVAAPGMQQSSPKPAGELQQAPDGFIMKNWY